MHSAKGVWCNGEKLGQEVLPLFPHLAGVVPGNHHSFKNVVLQTGSCYTNELSDAVDKARMLFLVQSLFDDDDLPHQLIMPGKKHQRICC